MSLKNKIIVLNHEEELKKYLANPNDFENSMNFLVNDPKKDWYEALGKTIYEIFGGNLPLTLKGIEEKIKQTGLLKKVFSIGRNWYITLAIQFITHTLGPNLLKELFGEPLLHSHFGEGFEHDGHQGEQYASYFVKIFEVVTHIGYDHRGTSIEFGRLEKDGKKPHPQRVAYSIAQIAEEVKALGHEK